MPRRREFKPSLKVNRWLLERRIAPDVWREEFMFTDKGRADIYMRHMIDRHNVDPAAYRLRQISDAGA